MTLKIQRDIEILFLKFLEKIPHGCHRPFALEFDDIVNLWMEAHQVGTFGFNQPGDAALRQVCFDVGNQAQASGDIPQGAHQYDENGWGTELVRICWIGLIFAQFKLLPYK